MTDAAAGVDPKTWALPPPHGLRRFLPILTWLPGYDRRWLRFDVIAGATVWGLLVPEMIAYSGLAGLPPQAGLYTLLASLAAYAIFGTSRHVVVAGTSASAVLIASGVASRGTSSPHDYAVLASGLVLLCGGLFLAAGILRLGFVAQFLSRPVIDGFVFGLAIFVTVSQLPKLLGIEKGEGDTIRQFFSLLSRLDDVHWTTFAVGGSALLLLFGVERFAPRLPGGLLALVLGIGVSAALDLSQHGVAVVGKVQAGLPPVGVPDLSAGDAVALTGVAAGMLLVIFSESLGAAQTFATKYGYEIDPNQEMIALGTANIGSGFIGGLAAGGSLSQSAVNEGAGARSELSPIVAAALALVTVLFLTQLFKTLPEAVLAALIIFAISHLYKVAEFRRYYSVRQPEFWGGRATLLGVIAWDVLPGLVIGVVSMLLLVVYYASRPHLGVLGSVPGTPGAYGDVGRHPDYKRTPGLLALRLEAPLFYANTTPVRDRVKSLVGASDPPPKAVILDLGANGQLDITSAEMLDELVRVLRSAGVDVVLAEVRAPVLEMADRTGLLDTIGDDHVFHTVDEAIRALGTSEQQ
jgi:SulP family sulfate permease